MTQEIEIHRSLQHDHVVGFLDYFEDHNFVYIVLELCSKRVRSASLYVASLMQVDTLQSLMELHKRRRAITEPEARYYTHQVHDRLWRISLLLKLLCRCASGHSTCTDARSFTAT